MIYCFDCKRESNYCSSDWMFIRCIHCNSESVIYYGDDILGDDLGNAQPDSRVARVIDKLEAAWWDNKELHFSQLIQCILDSPTLVKLTDDEFEEAIDRFLWRDK